MAGYIFIKLIFFPLDQQQPQKNQIDQWPVAPWFLFHQIDFSAVISQWQVFNHHIDFSAARSAAATETSNRSSYQWQVLPSSNRSAAVAGSIILQRND